MLHLRWPRPEFDLAIIECARWDRLNALGRLQEDQPRPAPPPEMRCPARQCFLAHVDDSVGWFLLAHVPAVEPHRLVPVWPLLAGDLAPPFELWLLEDDRVVSFQEVWPPTQG